MKKCVSSIVFALVASGAAAQPAPRLFVDASVFAGIEFREHSEEPTVYGAGAADVSGTVPGGTIAVGTFVAPRFSVRVEGAVPATLRATSTVTQAYGGSIRVSETDSREYRTFAGALLVGYHPASRGRLELGYLAGIAFIRDWLRDTITDSQTGTPDDYTKATAMTLVSYGPAPELGLDAAIRLGGALSIVPQLRAIGYGGAISLRPGVAIRWTR